MVATSRRKVQPSGECTVHRLSGTYATASASSSDL